VHVPIGLTQLLDGACCHLCIGVTLRKPAAAAEELTGLRFAVGALAVTCFWPLLALAIAGSGIAALAVAALAGAELPEFEEGERL